MNRSIAFFILAGSLLGFALLGTATVHSSERSVIEKGPVRYKVLATRPRLNRKVTGPLLHDVQGVPAEPVDSFVYDGVGSVPVPGHLRLLLDAEEETGLILASWSDENGDWTYKQSQLVHPEHLSGVRLGSSVTWLDSFLNEGAAPNVYLHGDTNAGFPVLPTLFAYLSTWGPAEVTLDGQPFDNPFEFPAPKWLGHVMVTEGVRFPDGSVRTLDGGIYHPDQLTQGAVETGDLEVHLVFHDERFPMTESFPPLFSFFYHLVFEDVKIEILQSSAAFPGESDLSGERRPRRGGELSRP